MSTTNDQHSRNSRWFQNENPVYRTFPLGTSSAVTHLLLSRGRIICASDDHIIRVYALATAEPLYSLEGHEGGVWSLAITKDTLVSGSTDRTVRVWDLKTRLCTHVFGGHTGTVRCLSILKPEWVDGENGVRERWPKRPLIVTGSRDTTVRVWNLPRPGEDEYQWRESDADEDDTAEVGVSCYW
jgi:F-box and WD-40 domain protein CDC4